MFDIINLLFTIPGALLSTLDLSDRLRNKHAKSVPPIETSSTSATPPLPVRYTNVDYENRKTILQIISYISLGIAIVIAVKEFCNVKNPPTLFAYDSVIFTAIPVFSNKLLFSLYRLIGMLLFLLIGLSFFAIFHHVNSKAKGKLHLITYVIFLFSAIYINILRGKTSLSDLALLFKTQDSYGFSQGLLISLIPFFILTTAAFAFIAILQLIYMLYLPELPCIYLRELLGRIARTLFIPFVLFSLTICWAYLL